MMFFCPVFMGLQFHLLPLIKFQQKLWRSFEKVLVIHIMEVTNLLEF